ncbi:MAG: hypothetical protein B6U89_01815 [Desulfurococcales archaeon ex4484_58]|nr:MAG: hypothetical protein B6U89_01815 [Desulfurococcales archaeon ex4484_58]
MHGYNKDKIVKINRINDIEKILSSFNNKKDNEKILLRGSVILNEELKKTISWKTIGLILSDGNFSNLIKGYGTIAFRGLSYDTAIAIIKTLIQIVRSITLRAKIGKGNRIYYDVIVPSTRCFKDLRYRIVSLLIKLDTTPDNVLSRLKMDELAALLAGIIDGDGYIGKPSTYISISFNMNSRKGKIINNILSFLEKKQYIIVNKYYREPKYEATFRFLNFRFLHKCLKYVYHNKRRKRMEKYMLDYARAYICPFSIFELKQILRNTSSAYIDYRKPPRNSKVLVLYIQRHDFEKIAYIWNKDHLSYKPRPIISKNRVMIKITEKCKENLFKLINEANADIEDKIIEKIRDFLGITKREIRDTNTKTKINI